MLKVRIFSAFAFAGLLGLAACGGDEAGEAELVEEPVMEAPAVSEPVVDPAVTEGAIIMDTSAVGTQVDTTSY